jgi:hypothetical protein
LVCGDRAQRTPVEVIEMRMRHENKIDRRQVMKVNSRFLQSLDHAEPHRPDRIDQHVGVVGLN